MPLEIIENEDISLLTERDWSQESFLGNDAMDVIWFCL